MSEVLDYKHLSEMVKKDVNKVPAEGNRDRFIRIAFDIFKQDEEPESLWVLECEGEDEFFVRTFDGDTMQKTASTKWQAYPDKSKENVTLAYKNTPIFRFSNSVWPFGPDDAHVFCNTLVKEAESGAFVSTVLEMASNDKKEAIFSTHPELKKFCE